MNDRGFETSRENVAALVRRFGFSPPGDVIARGVDDPTLADLSNRLDALAAVSTKGDSIAFVATAAQKLAALERTRQVLAALLSLSDENTRRSIFKTSRGSPPSSSSTALTR